LVLLEEYFIVVLFPLTGVHGYNLLQNCGLSSLTRRLLLQAPYFEDGDAFRKLISPQLHSERSKINPNTVFTFSFSCMFLRNAETFFLRLEDRDFSYGFSEIYTIAGWLCLSAEVSDFGTPCS